MTLTLQYLLLLTIMILPTERCDDVITVIHVTVTARPNPRDGVGRREYGESKVPLAPDVSDTSHAQLDTDNNFIIC